VTAPINLVSPIHAIAKTAVTGTNSTCLTLIGQAQRDLIHRFGTTRPKFLFKTWELDTVDSTQDYDLATLINADVAGLYLDGQFVISIHPSYRQTPLEHRPLADLLMLDPDGTAGTNKPVRWAWTGGTSDQEIRLQPTPDDAYVLTVVFFRALTYVTSTDTGGGVVLDWPAVYERLLVEHAAMIARRDARRLIDPAASRDHDLAVANFLVTERWHPPRGTRHVRPKGWSRRYTRFPVI
jgi:hypothetical protein